MSLLSSLPGTKLAPRGGRGLERSGMPAVDGLPVSSALDGRRKGFRFSTSIGDSVRSSFRDGGPNPPYPPTFSSFGFLGPSGLSPSELPTEACDLWLVVGPFELASLSVLPLLSVLCEPALLPFISNGPGAIVFIRFKSPPLVALLGLTGAYCSGSSYLAPPRKLAFFFDGSVMVAPNGGNPLSRFTADFGDRSLLVGKGAVALRGG